MVGAPGTVAATDCDVSTIVIVELVATTGPDVDPVLILIVNVCEPSVELSATIDTIKEPAFPVIVNDPLSDVKSALLVDV
jgi:hypothetical protein